jgi:hypothetical protein
MPLSPAAARHVLAAPSAVQTVASQGLWQPAWARLPCKCTLAKARGSLADQPAPCTLAPRLRQLAKVAHAAALGLSDAEGLSGQAVEAADTGGCTRLFVDPNRRRCVWQGRTSQGKHGGYAAGRRFGWALVLFATDCVSVSEGARLRRVGFQSSTSNNVLGHGQEHVVLMCMPC